MHFSSKSLIVIGSYFKYFKILGEFGKNGVAEEGCWILKQRTQKNMIENQDKKGISLAGFYYRNIGANLVGLLTVVLINFSTPSTIIAPHQNFIIREQGWLFLVVLEPIIMAIILLFQYLAQKPIADALKIVFGQKETHHPIVEKARRRILNLPYIFWIFNLAFWILLSIAVILYLAFLIDPPLKQSLLLMFRTAMIGLIAANLSFFLVEDHARRILIPRFFPKGRLKDVPGTLKISIIRRIRILYLAGTSVPMIILLGTLAFTLWDTGVTGIQDSQLSREIFFFTLVWCIMFVIIALRLNFLVGKSIIEPIKEMLGVIHKLRDGDFNQRIAVLSNDEIGTLGDAGNDMIAGLAERERIRETFGKYVTPEIRDQILEGRIPLDGERAEATLLFSDLRGFTSFVEANDPKEVIRGMRDYFTAMRKAIRSHGGLVLQYVGDEIESVFGVPVKCDDHKEKAILAALEMRERLEVLNDERTRVGKVPFGHGIGIHTGSVLAGNTGSEDRLSYALIGDTVNVASRIGGLTKLFECDILVSQETALGLLDSFRMEKKPTQMVKGYSKPVTVYRIL
jgi:class 3 adenylate cyclase